MTIKKVLYILVALCLIFVSLGLVGRLVGSIFRVLFLGIALFGIYFLWCTLKDFLHKR